MDRAEWMVEQIRRKYGLHADKVLDVMLRVPREEFVDEKSQEMAYEDRPIPIGHGQTISQPLTVAFMTDLLEVEANDSVLEIGTGSGYQAAVLSRLCRKVYSLERIEELADAAREALARVGADNVEVIHASGHGGYPEHAPYERILVTAGIRGEVPGELFEQLADGGVLVAPVGGVMMKYSKSGDEIVGEEHGYFSFVPFVEKMKP